MVLKRTWMKMQENARVVWPCKNGCDEGSEESMAE